MALLEVFRQFNRTTTLLEDLQIAITPTLLRDFGITVTMVRNQQWSDLNDIQLIFADTDLCFALIDPLWLNTTL